MIRIRCHLCCALSAHSTLQQVNCSCPEALPVGKPRQGKLWVPRQAWLTRRHLKEREEAGRLLPEGGVTWKKSRSLEWENEIKGAATRRELGRNKVSGGRVGEGEGGELGLEGCFTVLRRRAAWKGMSSQHGGLGRGGNLL